MERFWWPGVMRLMDACSCAERPIVGKGGRLCFCLLPRSPFLQLMPHPKHACCSSWRYDGLELQGNMCLSSVSSVSPTDAPNKCYRPETYSRELMRPELGQCALPNECSL